MVNLIWVLALILAFMDVALALIGIPVFWIVGTEAAVRAIDAGQHFLAGTISGVLGIAILVCMEAFCQGILTIQTVMNRTGR